MTKCVVSHKTGGIYAKGYCQMMTGCHYFRIIYVYIEHNFPDRVSCENVINL